MMIGTTEKAAGKLKEDLLEKIFRVGLGFRIDLETDEKGQRTYTIKLDNRCATDEVVDSHGVKVFLGHYIASQLKELELDYIDSPEETFYFKKKERGDNDTRGAGNGRPTATPRRRTHRTTGRTKPQERKGG